MDEVRHRLGGCVGRSLLEGVEPEGQFVTAFCDGGYTTNLPLADVMGGKAWVAFNYGGAPLQPAHGGPARLLVPHLYFWKSAKWVRGLEITSRSSLVFGSRSATTITAIHGGNSGTRATSLASHDRRGKATGDGRRSRSHSKSPDWPGHLAGQHVDVRLTAEDGYQAERTYSIASAPEAAGIELTVERIADGEVSPYLGDVLREGDQLELRGPIGGYFIWEKEKVVHFSWWPGVPGCAVDVDASGIQRSRSEQRAGPSSLYSFFAHPVGRHLSRGAGPACGRGRRADESSIDP